MCGVFKPQQPYWTLTKGISEFKMCIINCGKTEIYYLLYYMLKCLGIVDLSRKIA